MKLSETPFRIPRSGIVTLEEDDRLVLVTEVDAEDRASYQRAWTRAGFVEEPTEDPRALRFRKRT